MNVSVSSALAWLLTYAVHSTVLLALAWLITRSSSVPAAIRDVVWKVALVGGLMTTSVQLRLAVRPVGSFSLSASPIRGAPVDHASGIRSTLDNSAPPASVASDVRTSDVGSVNATRNAETTRPIARTALPQQELVPSSNGVGASQGIASRSWQSVVVIGWGVLAVLLAAAYVVRRLILTGRLANRHAIADGPLPAMLDALCRTVNYQTHIKLSRANTIASPVALGLNEICVPDAVLTDLEPEQQRSLLAHELAHLARRDPMWLNVAVLLERVLFFQPLNRVARKALQRNAELLCDDWAAKQSGSGLPLAHCLARVAEWIEVSPLGVPVSGMAEQRSLLVTRVARLIEGPRAPSRVSRASVGFVTVAMLGVTTAAVPGVQATTATASQSQNRLGLSPTSAPNGDRIERVASGEPTSATRQRDAGSAPASAEQEDPAVIAGLIERLKDTDAGVRRAAAQSLGRLKSQRAVPALMAAINDRNRDVRAAIADALGEIGDQSAVSALLKLLNDESPDVRHNVLGALSRFSESLSAGSILPALKDVNPDNRQRALDLLGEVGDRSAQRDVLPLLNDSNADVRHAAIHALEHLGDRSVAPQLTAALKDANANVRMSALSALRELKIPVSEQSLADALADDDADVRREALNYLENNPVPSFVPTLKKLLDDPDGDVRERAVSALAEIREPAARAALRAALTSPDPKVRRRAAEALGDRP